MKAKFLLIFFLLFSFTARCQTTIAGGNVSGNWLVASSPYFIQGNIEIAKDSTLTIQPGVSVVFTGIYRLLVSGRLVSIGTLTDTIIFSPQDTTLGWGGIVFDNTSISNDSSKIKYCKLQYGIVNTFNNNGVITINYFSKVIVSNCLISMNRRTGGISCTSGNPVIINNTITFNNSDAVGGIYCHDCNAIIRNNIISNNISRGNGAGIHCSNSGSIIINNIISDNWAADSSGGYGRGGGIALFNSNALIDSNIISGNIAYNQLGGGGMYIELGNLIISNNTITRNSSRTSAAGIFCFSGSHIIRNNTITNNTFRDTGLSRNRNGGGIFLSESLSKVSDNIIQGNVADNGAGIYCESNGRDAFSPHIEYNIISNNTSALLGGGIYCSRNNPIIENNKISNNTAGLGAGIACNESKPLISNNVISNNTAIGNGGGIYCFGINGLSIPDIVNNVLCNNSAETGGGMSCNNSSPNLFNTIFYGNSAVLDGPQIYLFDNASDPNFYYCDVEGDTAEFGRYLFQNIDYTGTYQNNININPLFIQPSFGSGAGFNGLNADWSLQGNSPCIDAGNPIGSYPSTDIIGNPRINNGIIDIGAFENLTTSIFDIQDEEVIKIYPNPFSLQITINFSNNLDYISLKLVNATGQVVKFISSISNKILVIDKEEMLPGIYYLQIEVKKNYYTTKKIILQ